MRVIALLGVATALSGCVVQQIGPPGVELTRTVAVPARDVLVFDSAEPIPGRYAVVEEVWVKDTGEDTPEEMREHLRVIAGAAGANGIILAKSNRENNKLRIDLRPTLDNPFDYYQGTAIWVGDGERPVKYLGRIK